jgi:REP element-mobilizing transposase RayT
VNWRAYFLESEFAKRTMAQVLRQNLAKFDVTLLSDVLMDNHYHMVIQSPGEASFTRLTSRRTDCRHERPYPRRHECSQVVTQFMREFKCRSARHIQDQLDLTGHLWQGAHHRRLITDVRQLVVAIAYDHRNPVLAAMTGSPESFARSSARWWRFGEPSDIPLCTRPDFPFGITRESFRELLLAFQEDRAARDVFDAFAAKGIPLSSPRGQRLMDQLLEEAHLDPLAGPA